MQPLPVKMPLPCDFSLVAYYPMLIFLVIVIGLATVIMILAHIFNPRRITPVKQMPYESGMDPIGDARGKFDVRFYLVAILFLVFDVELLFLYPWAVATQGENPVIVGALRTIIFWEMLIFVGTLLLAWAVAWRKGVFQWR
jgi:NADH-quinone oxidoreductase subunit A